MISNVSLPRFALVLFTVCAIAAPHALAQTPTPTPAKKPAPAAGDKPAKGPAAAKPSAMVSVPAGPFQMGCNPKVDDQCTDLEKPGKTVDVKAFEIDVTEVTVAQFASCVAAKGCSGDGLAMPFYGDEPQSEYAEFCTWGKPGLESHPINCVDWNQASAYCKWAGRRLPTEPEWEKAARGSDGRKYPWGNATYGKKSGKLANVADRTGLQRFPDWIVPPSYDDGFLGTAPVGSFPKGASPSGALDMVGNVWEWTADTVDTMRPIKGASWRDAPVNARASARVGGGPTVRSPDVGFRCAK